MDKSFLKRFSTFCFITACAMGSVDGIEGFYASPALHGDTLIFCSEGDLWVADLPSHSTERQHQQHQQEYPALANRLTRSGGQDGRPCISPDGEWVAFASDRACCGRDDVWIAPIAGGAAVRLTFEGVAPDPPWDGGRGLAVCGWSPDGGAVLYRTPSFSRHPPDTQLALVAAFGAARGEVGVLPLAQASDGVLVETAITPRPDAPKLLTLFYVRLPSHGNLAKGYRGGFVEQIWTLRLQRSGDGSSSHLLRAHEGATESRLFTSEHHGASRCPMWCAQSRRLFFLSDRATAYPDRPTNASRTTTGMGPAAVTSGSEAAVSVDAALSGGFGRMELWSNSVDGDNAIRHTAFGDASPFYELTSASLSDGRAVCAVGATLHLVPISFSTPPKASTTGGQDSGTEPAFAPTFVLAPAPAAPPPLRLRLRSERDLAQPFVCARPMDHLTHMSLRADGRCAALVLRGQAFVVPVTTPAGGRAVEACPGGNLHVRTAEFVWDGGAARCNWLLGVGSHDGATAKEAAEVARAAQLAPVTASATATSTTAAAAAAGGAGSVHNIVVDRRRGSIGLTLTNHDESVSVAGITATVVVSQLETAGVAWLAGVRVGDQLHAIDGVVVRNHEAAMPLINRATEFVTLTVHRKADGAAGGRGTTVAAVAAVGSAVGKALYSVAGKALAAVAASDEGSDGDGSGGGGGGGGGDGAGGVGEAATLPAVPAEPGLWRLESDGMHPARALDEGLGGSGAQMLGAVPSPDGMMAAVWLADASLHIWYRQPRPRPMAVAGEPGPPRLSSRLVARGRRGVGNAIGWKSPFVGGGPLSWSPDSSFLAYTMQDDTGLSQVWVVDAKAAPAPAWLDGRSQVNAGAQRAAWEPPLPVRVTTARHHSWSPCWSLDRCADGETYAQWLYFLSDRHLRVDDATDVFGERAQQPNVAKSVGVFAVALRPAAERLPPWATASELADRDCELAPPPPSPPANLERARGEMHLPSAAARLHRVPVPPGAYARVAVAAGERLLLWGESNEELLRVELAKARQGSGFEPTVLATDVGRGFAVSANGERVLVKVTDALHVGNTDGDGRLELCDGNRLRLSEVVLRVLPEAEWRASFVDAWRLMRDGFYDASMQGVDWDAVYTAYSALLPRVGCAAELRALVRLMYAELRTMHVQLHPPRALRTAAEESRVARHSLPPAFLGARLRPRSASEAATAAAAAAAKPAAAPSAVSASSEVGVELMEVYEAGADSPWCAPAPQQGEWRSGHGSLMLGPLERPVAGPPLRSGDEVLSINGVRVRSAAAVGEALLGRAGQQVRLRARTRGGGTGGAAAAAATTTATTAAWSLVELVVIPLSIEENTALRYAAWCESRRAVVERTAAGRIGYVHMRDMERGSYGSFAEQFYAASAREALIIDVRHNRGGNIDAWLLQRLSQRAWMHFQPRHGGSYPSPAGVNAAGPALRPMCVLVDQTTMSNGEGFAEGFRRLGLGPVVGMRTWGGFVWTCPGVALADGTALRLPEIGAHDGRGNWLIEGRGVEPDVTVDNEPCATHRGDDRQLNEALALLLERLKREPVTEAVPPPSHPR